MPPISTFLHALIWRDGVWAPICARAWFFSHFCHEWSEFREGIDALCWRADHCERAFHKAFNKADR